MTSPFKFLDAFTLADRDVFFGREQEIEDLYELTFKARLILVYGNSGTGKTSLIQCGLAGKFDGPDWFPFWIRKNGNINNSLRAALRRPLKGKAKTEVLTDMVSELFNYYLRPIYLIFDQFEELFILGTHEERQTFIQEIRDLFEMELPCKIIFVIREEYLANLYDFEKTIPAISDHRLRVEPMNAAKAKEVMASSFEKFNIGLEGDVDERLEEMLDNISGERFGIHLPYLQVYLDMMYRNAYRRTADTTAGNEDPLSLVFTKQEIRRTGTIDNVLEKFLSEQEKDLQKQLCETHPGLAENTVKNILDGFVTEEGTKRPVHYRREGKQVIPASHTLPFFPSLSPGLMSACLQSLEERRLLRFSEETIELAHDSLAELINNHRTEEQRQLNQYRRILNNAYVAHIQFGGYLSAPQLIGLTPVVPKLGLNDAQKQFFEASREKMEAEQEKLARDYETQKTKTRTIQRYFIVSIVLGALVFIFFIIARLNQQTAENAREALQSANDSLIAQKDSTRTANLNYWKTEGIRLKESKKDFAMAIQPLEFALQFALNREDSSQISELIAEVSSKVQRMPLVDSLIAAGDLAYDGDRITNAWEAYEDALRQGVRLEEVRTKMSKTKNRAYTKIGGFLTDAETYRTADVVKFIPPLLDSIEQLRPILDEEQWALLNAETRIEQLK